MRFPTLTDEQLEAMYKKFEPGICDFHIESVREGKSEKSGNHYMELILRVFDVNGTEKQVYDYLMATKNMVWKLKQFFKATELSDIYESGQEITPDMLVNKQGRCEIMSRKEEDKHGNMVDRLRIKNYLEEKTEKAFDDDIPF